AGYSREIRNVWGAAPRPALGNLMINVRPTNVKLRDRCIRILMELGDCDRATAAALIDRTGSIRESLDILGK
ncbi:MAG: hypothetical protein MJ192_08915, partial [Clostridia bacterium]|nr:hypothetical protein [Clostridia bacterium]